MSFNLIEALQQKLGYQPLHKIDPNTQVALDAESGASLLQQAAITTVLMGMYRKYHEAKSSFDWGTNSTSLLQEIFDVKTDKVVMAVANYSHVGTDKAKIEMENVAIASNEIIHQEVKEPDWEKQKTFILDQRNNILVYLPPDVELGKLLDDETIDDRTHKMEGPVSGLMHVIEKVFSSSK
ncbi:MAG: hypothetical protein H7178_06395 [Chitinophagaceae bacterium]|nr:hypothetical protein [Chitinophagaceae bacterium]